jgi:hypothetical protein
LTTGSLVVPILELAGSDQDKRATATDQARISVVHRQPIAIDSQAADAEVVDLPVASTESRANNRSVVPIAIATATVRRLAMRTCERAPW